MTPLFSRAMLLILALLVCPAGCSSTSDPAPVGPPAIAQDPGNTSVPVPVAPEKRFADITSWAGLNIGVGGEGHAFVDVDSDGFDDIVAPASGRTFVLKNRGDGSFFPIAVLEHTNHEGLYVYGIELTGDDHMDLLLILDVGPTIWRGWGNGAFEPLEQGLPGGIDLLHSVATFGDFDGDGQHDLYLGRMSKVVGDGRGFAEFPPGYCPTPEELEAVVNEDEPASDVLLLRRGDGWEDATEAFGLATPRYTQAAMAADLNDDGRLDLTVGTEGFRVDAAFFGGAPGAAMLERGESGGMDHVTSAMGYDAVDMDRDGDLDLYITDERGGVGDKVYLQQSDGTWKFATDSLGLESTKDGTGWGVGFHDFDHDADLDLVVANGLPLGGACPGGEQENFYFEGDGTSWSRVTAPKGSALEALENSRAAVFSDIDGDGDLDALISNAAGAPTLMRNDMATGNWIQVTPRHPTLRPAVGTRLELTVAGQVHRRDVHGTPSYGGSSTEAVHFGLGDATQGDLRIIWPDGHVQDVGPVQAGQRIQATRD